MPRLKRIIGGFITHLSLCAIGASNIQTIYKAKDGKSSEINLEVLTKAMTEQGEIVAAVYVPELPDSQGDIASAEVIKELAYSFSKIGKGIDITHNEKVMPKDAVYVAESFIIQKSDPRFNDITDYDGNSVEVTGGWGVVIKVDDPDLRARYRSGEWKGISMGGLAAKKPEQGVLIVKTNKNVKDFNMDKDEMEKILKANSATLATSIATAVTEAITKALEIKEEKTKKKEVSKVQKAFLERYSMPAIPLNPTTEQLAHLEKCVRVVELAKATNADDANSILVFHKSAKAIMEGKAPDVALDPWGFQTTNQEPDTQIKKTKEPANFISWDVKASDTLSMEEVKKMVDSVPLKGELLEKKTA